MTEKKRNLDALLGKESDSALGREFGLTRQRIGQRRSSKGIPVYRPGVRPLCAAVTKTDMQRTDKAAKKQGMTRSAYVREAVREKNLEVLGK